MHFTGSFDGAISQGRVLGPQPSCLQEGEAWDELEKPGIVQLPCLFPGREDPAFGGCWGGTKRCRDSTRNVCSAAGTSGEPGAHGALQWLQKCPPGWGLQLGGNLKLGTNPTNQAPRLELSPGKKAPQKHSWCPCQRWWWSHIQTGMHSRALGHNDLGAEAL